MLPTIKSKDIASVIYHKILNFINLGHAPVVPINYFIIQIKQLEFLRVDVFDKDLFKNNFIGYVLIPLSMRAYNNAFSDEAVKLHDAKGSAIIY